MKRVFRYAARACLGLMALGLVVDLSSGWLATASPPAGPRAQELLAGLAERPDDVARLKELGIIFQRLGATQDDRRAVIEADRYLARAAALAPGDAEILAWWGSVEVMKGRDGWFPPLKLVRVWRGMGRLDRAAAMAPDNVIVRLVRGRTALRVPWLFGWNQTAVTDLTFLRALPEAETAPLRPQIHLHLGSALRRAGQTEQARAEWQQVVEGWPTTPEAREARGLLTRAM
jgi:tetratricopeptide (TPR) repeat protein